MEKQYLLSESDLERLMELLEALHGAVVESVRSRELKVPPWEEGGAPEVENFRAIADEIGQIAEERTNRQCSFDF